jgi:hypothetical protein
LKSPPVRRLTGMSDILFYSLLGSCIGVVIALVQQSQRRKRAAMASVDSWRR